MLAAYDFTIQWRKGKDNLVDGLSRRPDYIIDNGPIDFSPIVELLRKRIPVVGDPYTNYIRDRDGLIIGVITRAIV
jgi:hypothetical protein